MSLVLAKPLRIQQALRVRRAFSNAQWDIRAYSQRCPGKQSSNEDAAAVIPISIDSLILVVADGCGGMRGGEQASRIAVQSMVRAARRCGQDPRLVRSAILDGIEQANEAILALKIGAACTMAVVECQSHRIRSYHAGDTKVLVANQRGKLLHETLCHSPVGYAVESGMLSQLDAIHHDERHLVSNLLGSSSLRIEIGPWVPMNRNRSLLIASDGLFDNLTVDEVVSRMRSTSAENSVDRLAKLAQHRMRNESSTTPSKPDDVTIIVANKMR